jgi:acyl dehydratase
MSQVTLQTVPGTELPSFKRTISSAIIRSRQWAGTNPIHVDESVAKAQGFTRPIATGHIASAYIQESCIRFFGPHYFCDASLDVRFISPFYLDDVLTVGGKIREAKKEAGGVRFTADMWCTNQQGEQVLAAEVKVLVTEE